MNNELVAQAQNIKSKITGLIESDNLKEALDIIQSYKEIIVNDPEIYSMEGVAYVKLGDYHSAAAVFKTGLVLNISYFDILYNLGIVYEHMGELEESRNYFERALLFTRENGLIESILNILLTLEKRIQSGSTGTLKHSNFIDILLHEMYLSQNNHFHYNIDIASFEMRGLAIKDANYVATGFNKEKILSSFEGISDLYDGLMDDYSRNLLVRLMSYKLLGNQKVMLPTNQKVHWSNRNKASETMVESKNTIITNFMGLELDYFDLTPLGYDLNLYFNSIGISNTFIEKQYEYNKSGHNIGVNKGDVVIDAGGCWGDTALYFAHEVGAEGSVYTYEFIPSNLEILETNINLNPSVAERITIVKNPVWSTSGETTFYTDNGPASRVTNLMNSSDPGNFSTTLSIDDLVELHRIPKVDFIKMDIEGAELSALQGAIKTIQTYKPTLAISLYHNISDFSDIYKFISDLNLEYEYYLDHYTIFDEETILYAKQKHK